jgi:hypothetical protein
MTITTFLNATDSLGQSEKFSWLDEEIVLENLLKDLSNQNTIETIYVDIGAGNGAMMSNTAKLAKNGWKGLAIECSAQSAEEFAKIYTNYPLIKFHRGVVTPLNVNQLLESYNIPKNFGVLSLDIDGYDYFVLDSLLQQYRPSVIITEINEKIPPPLEFTVLFNETYSWEYNHFYGQSICKLKKLCDKYNYAIVHLEYNNAFIVPMETYEGKPLSAEEAYSEGYKNKPKRIEFFPWNSDVEHLLTATPEESWLFLNQFFKKYEGKYTLFIGNEK